MRMQTPRHISRLNTAIRWESIAMLLFLWPLAALGQTGTESPHGELLDQLTCISCHSNDAWTPTKEVMDFNHSLDAGFALLDSHSNLSCISCHSDLKFDAPKSNVLECQNCHIDPHLDSVIQDCSTCHDATSFRAIRREQIHINSSFDLIGVHQIISCETCHSLPGLELLFSQPPSSNNDCASCHTSDYEVAHAGSGFPTTCIDCHSQTTWAGAAFDHLTQSGGFDLIGAHDIVSCATCHSLPGLELLFSPPPSSNNDCVSCHTSDYEVAHAGSGFPTTCIDCHSQTTWAGASFDHDALYFPIYSGTHRNEWTQCADCHTQAPATFATFSCIDCHEHTKSRTDSEHNGVQNYVYESLACFSCHPQGRE